MKICKWWVGPFEGNGSSLSVKSDELF